MFFIIFFSISFRVARLMRKVVYGQLACECGGVESLQNAVTENTLRQILI